MRKILLLLTLTLCATPLAAQQPASPTEGDLIDRVLAVVGDTVLLLSDIDGAVRQMEASGQPLPTDPAGRAELIDQLIEGRVSDLVILQAAKDEGIGVTDAEVAEQVDANIRNVVNQYGSDAALDAALAGEGLTRASYRAILIEQNRTQQVLDTYMRQAMANRTRPLISESEIRESFEQRRAALGERPVRVSLQQVIVKTAASDSARATAMRTAEQVLQELRDGGDFEVLARRFSDDPGTKEQGGDLGWFRPGRMVPEFEGVAYALRPGETSGIVRTEFGYHIIRVDRIRGAERKARHILIRPTIAPADAQLARTRADSVATAIRAGASVPPLSRAYGTTAAEAEVSRIPVDQLPPAYRTALQAATSGQVVGPIEVEGAGQPNYAVVKVTERQEAGPYALDDVRERLVETLQQQKMVLQIVEELRNRVYVQVLQ